MSFRVSENQIKRNPTPKGMLTALFSVALLLGILSVALSEVPVFCAVSIVIIGVLIFRTARNIPLLISLTLIFIMTVSMTDSFAVPTLFIGSVFSAAVVVFFYYIKALPAAFGITLAAYAIAAFLVGPVPALVTLIPLAAGLLLALLLRGGRLAESVGLLTALIMAIALSVIFLADIDLTALGDGLRKMLEEKYRSIGSGYIIIEESSIGLLASYFVNLLPGIVFAALSSVIYLSFMLARTWTLLSGTGERLPNGVLRLELSPVSGVLYVLAFLFASAFAIEGSDFEMAGAVMDNITVALSPAFVLIGFRSFGESAIRRILRGGGIMFFVIGIILIIASPSSAAILFTALGVVDSFKPIGRALGKKIKKSIDKN